MKPKTSPIWRYFVSVDESNAKCKICERVYSRKGRTTTSLKNHIKAMHPEIYLEFEELNETKKISMDLMQKKVEDSVKKLQAWEQLQADIGETGRHPVLDFDNEDCLASTLREFQQDGVVFTRIMIRRAAFELADQLGLDVPFNRGSRMAGHSWLLSFLERHPELGPCLDQGDKDKIDKDLMEGIKRTLAREVTRYQLIKKKESQEKVEDSKDDPLTIKVEIPAETDDGSLDLGHMEFTTDSSSNDDNITEAPQECSSSNNIAIKRKRKISKDESNNSNKEELVEVKCDGIDLLFLGYAASLKKMTRRKQITLKHEIAKLFMEAELSELE